MNDAQILENWARWLGVAVAVLGALLVNPDATLQRWQSFNAWALRLGRRGRGFLARFLPALRRDVTIHAAGGFLNLSGGRAELIARGIAGWGPDATTAEKIRMLDERTRSLDREVGELQRSLKQTATDIRNELSATAEGLRKQVSQVRQAVDDLRTSTIRDDAGALPIIVVGVVLGGLAPDAHRVPLWIGWSVVLLLVAWALRDSWHVWRRWRRVAT